MRKLDKTFQHGVHVTKDVGLPARIRHASQADILDQQSMVNYKKTYFLFLVFSFDGKNFLEWGTQDCG